VGGQRKQLALWRLKDHAEAAETSPSFAHDNIPTTMSLQAAKTSAAAVVEISALKERADTRNPISCSVLSWQEPDGVSSHACGSNLRYERERK
jgi:hypothetical protein